MKRKPKRESPAEQISAPAEITIQDEDVADLGSLRYEMVRFGVSALARLRAMDFETRKTMLAECSEYSLREPLQYHYKRDLKVLALNDRCDGAEIIALMAFGLYVHMGENIEACGALFDMFPEIEAALRIDRRLAAAEAQRLASVERARLAAEAPLFASTIAPESVAGA